MPLGITQRRTKSEALEAAGQVYLQLFKRHAERSQDFLETSARKYLEHIQFPPCRQTRSSSPGQASLPLMATDQTGEPQLANSEQANQELSNPELATPEQANPARSGHWFARRSTRNPARNSPHSSSPSSEVILAREVVTRELLLDSRVEVNGTHHLEPQTTNQFTGTHHLEPQTTNQFAGTHHLEPQIHQIGSKSNLVGSKSNLVGSRIIQIDSRPDSKLGRHSRGFLAPKLSIKLGYACLVTQAIFIIAITVLFLVFIYCSWSDKVAFMNVLLPFASHFILRTCIFGAFNHCLKRTGKRESSDVNPLRIELSREKTLHYLAFINTCFDNSLLVMCIVIACFPCKFTREEAYNAYDYLYFFTLFLLYAGNLLFTYLYFFVLALQASIKYEISLD